MNTKLQLTTALLLGAAVASPVLADEPTAQEKAIKYRQAAMTLVGSNFKPMGAMIKGELPYDAEIFARHASDMAAVSGIDILRGFPEDSEGEGSEAKGEIWLEWEDFAAKMDDMKTEADKLAATAASGDKAAIKKQFAATGETCKSCHKKFKQ
jgi:cytochrome c556